jgi:hypothetical protein
MGQDRRRHVRYTSDWEYDDLTEEARCIICGEINFKQSSACPGKKPTPEVVP